MQDIAARFGQLYKGGVDRTTPRNFQRSSKDTALKTLRRINIGDAGKAAARRALVLLLSAAVDAVIKLLNRLRVGRYVSPEAASPNQL